MKILSMFLIVTATISAQAQEFELNKEKSQITFISYTKILGIKSEVRGSFKDFSIKAIKNPILTESKAEVIISTNSIDTNNNARDKHLKKEDFFYEEKFKNIIFKSNLIKNTENKNYILSGILTVKGKDLPISFKVSAEAASDNTWHIKGDTMLSRSAIGINYKAPFFLPEVKDEVKAIFDIWLKPKISK